MCSDNEHFLSADEQRIVMWHFDKPEVIYIPIELTEPKDLITHVEYHKKNPNLFLYSTTGGYFDYCDLRVCSQLKQAAIRFQKTSKKHSDDFFSKVVRRIGSANFAPTSENYIFSREYLSICIWDIRSNRMPVQNLNVTDYLDKHLLSLYENEKIYDTFKLNISPCSTQLLTGAYQMGAHVIDLQHRVNTKIEVKFANRRGTHVGKTRRYNGRVLAEEPAPITNNYTTNEEHVYNPSNEMSIDLANAGCSNSSRSSVIADVNSDSAASQQQNSVDEP